MKCQPTPTRKNSKSEWKRLLDAGDADKIVDAFVRQIATEMQRKDYTYHPVSDIGIVAPRCSSKPHGAIAARIAKDLHALHGLKYTTCLAHLKALYLKQTEEQFEKRRRGAVALAPQSDLLWRALLERPVSEVVAHPVAMPVTIAPTEKFAPLIACLANNTAVQTDTPFPLGHIDGAGRLDLCKQGVGEQSIAAIMAPLKDNTHVRHFLLGNNIVDAPGCNAIAETIRTNHRIETYYLAGNRIDAAGMGVIAAALADDTAVKHLWLKRNPIMNPGANVIATMLETNRTLQTLDLHNTGISDVSTLFAALHKNTGLEILYLDANGITDAGPIIKYFATVGRRGITSLSLTMNRLRDKGCVPLVKVLGEYGCLLRLSLGSNGVTAKTAKAIYAAFVNDINLRVLDLGMYLSTNDMGETTNRLGDAGAAWIALLLAENTSLLYLDLSQNCISEEGFGVVAHQLCRGNDSLQYFRYAQYGTFINDTLVKRKLRRNRASAAFSFEDVRDLKFGKAIHNIYSVYRNKSCAMREHK